MLLNRQRWLSKRRKTEKEQTKQHKDNNYSFNEPLTNLNVQQLLRDDPNRNSAMAPDQICSSIYQLKQQKQIIVGQPINILQRGISRSGLCKSI